jgi:glycosyltransferase involved in cell wall biosynthesis
MKHQRVIVAIPARNEEASIRQCIQSVDQAAAEIPVPVLVVVAADTCSDDTYAAARDTPTEFCSVVVIEGTWGRAGAARAAAVQHGISAVSENGSVWIANTDADCVVPPLWLRIQLELASDLDVIAGIVELDPVATAPAVFEAFTASYVVDADDHPHVHGANIGICSAAYLAVGGWCSQTVVGEDHVIWNALRDLGHRVRQTTRLRVLTSARTRSRVVGGFATNLDNLTASDPTLIASHA